MKKITVIGSGYVGLVTGACFAEKGLRVTCLDIDQKKIDALQKGLVPFYEPGLSELIQELHSKLRFTTSYQEAVENADICFLALPTPSQIDGSCDYSYVISAAKEIAMHMRKYLIIVNKSTIPVGTTKMIRTAVQEVLNEKEISIPFDVVSNPEFLQEGSALENCRNPDRVIIGVESQRAQDILTELYSPFHDRLLVMDIASAELTKYAANTMLALRISFMNLFAGLCEKVGADIEAIKEGIGSDPRIGNKYLKAGIGFGGSCLPKDIQALCAIAKEQEYPSEFFEMILDINQAQIKRFFHKVLSYFEMPDGKTLAIWGLSFKPLTDDLRQAPSLDFIQMALEHGFQLRLFDPVSMDKALALFCDCETIIFCSDEEETASGADAVIILTEWPQFHTIDLEKIGLLMNNKAIFDGRGIFDEEEISELGFDYFRLGKKGMGHGNTRPVLGKNS